MRPFTGQAVGDVARGLIAKMPGGEVVLALQAWRDRMNERPSARA